MYDKILLTCYIIKSMYKTKLQLKQSQPDLRSTDL